MRLFNESDTNAGECYVVPVIRIYVERLLGRQTNARVGSIVQLNDRSRPATCISAHGRPEALGDRFESTLTGPTKAPEVVV